MFIGYSRSSHSLVGAILDAHPQIIIPHEYHVLGNWQKYRSLRALSKTLPKYQLFLDLHQLSTEQAMFGRRSSAWVTRRNRSYSYNIPGLWQGGYEKTIKVRYWNVSSPSFLRSFLASSVPSFLRSFLPSFLPLFPLHFRFPLCFSSFFLLIFFDLSLFTSFLFIS